MRGRKPLATVEQRRRVYDLADAGESTRSIAEQVFGSRRVKNRVLRLLARRRRSVGGVDLETLSVEEIEQRAAELDVEAVTLEEAAAALEEAAFAELERAETRSLAEGAAPRRFLAAGETPGGVDDSAEIEASGGRPNLPRP